MTDAEIAGYMDWRGPGAYTAHHMKRIKRIIEEVQRREREACVRLASEPQYWPLPNFTHAPSERTMGRIEGEKEMSRQIAAAIRARSNK